MFELVAIQKELAAAFGPAGQESEVAACIKELAQKHADESYIDTLGNLIVRKKGPGAKVMLAAHMDSIGLVATHIDKEGFVRFGKLGGVSPGNLPGMAVRFQNGTRGVVTYERAAEPKDWKLESFYIDVGAKKPEEVSVKVGDAAVFVSETYVQNGRLLSPYLDDRIGCAVLLQTLAQMKEPKHDVYFVFSAQEEVGGRGATTAAFSIAPDLALAVDVTGTGDTPGAKPRMDVKLGGGAAIKIMDQSLIAHPAVVSWLENAAQAHNIACQREVLERGGTDAGVIHMSRAGVRAGVVSIPTRYIHSGAEMADVGDIEACVSLLTAALSGDIPAK